jgi:hypothetical protein
MSKFQKTIRGAQDKVRGRAKAIEQDARKLAETLQDRAQGEMKALIKIAREGSREQVFAFGVELEKWGKKLQEAATSPVQASAENTHTEQVQ